MPETARDATSGAFGGNAEWFTTDISPATPQSQNAPIFMLTFAINTLSPVEVTLDSGANFVALRDEQGNTDFQPNTTYTRPIPVRNGDLFNVRATNALTVTYARVDEWS